MRNITPAPGWLLLKTFPYPSITSGGVQLPQVARDNLLRMSHGVESVVHKIGPPLEEALGDKIVERPSRYKPGQHVLHPPMAGIDLGLSFHRDRLGIRQDDGWRLLREEDIQGTVEEK